MTYSARDLEKHYRSADELANQLTRDYAELLGTTNQSLDKIEKQREECALNLAQQYLQELTQSHLNHAESLTGYRGFQRLKPIEAMGKERTLLQKKIQTIQADERYQKRKLLVGDLGSETQKLNECRQFLAQWEIECNVFESLEGFMDLIEVKYDTPEFDVPWHSPKYWRYWATGDKICETLEMNDFGDDVLPTYLKVAKERNKWSDQVNQQQAKVNAIHQMVEQHDRAQARLPQLETLYLEDCHKQLQEFLLLADLPLLDEWRKRDAHDDRVLQMSLRRLSGLSAKMDFITKLKQNEIESKISDLHKRRKKYQRKYLKYQRPKYYATTFSERDMDLKFIQKSEQYFKRRQKISKMVDRIEHYDHYERFSLDNDANLWWEEMTGRPPSSSMTPDLYQWYQRNDREVLYDEEFSQSAQAQAVQDIEDDLGYIS